MYKEIINNADEGKLRELTKDMLSMIKETNKELYDTLEIYTRKCMVVISINGYLKKQQMKW